MINKIYIQNIIITIIVLLIILLIFFNFNLTGFSVKNVDIIKIGFIGPFSGDTAVFGKVEKTALDIAVEEINSGGGINGKKIVGTAQRVIIKKGGGRIVLAQAFILIDVLLDEIIKPVNLCYQLSDKAERVQAQVHTTLFEHIVERPSIEQLYQQLTQAFVDSALY